MIHVETADLLVEDKTLLTVNFEDFGEGHTLIRQYWLADMEAAVSAADHVRRGSWQALRTRYGRLNQRANTSRGDVLVDSEGSMRWRRRLRRI